MVQCPSLEPWREPMEVPGRFPEGRCWPGFQANEGRVNTIHLRRKLAATGVLALNVLTEHGCLRARKCFAVLFLLSWISQTSPQKCTPRPCSWEPPVLPGASWTFGQDSRPSAPRRLPLCLHPGLHKLGNPPCSLKLCRFGGLRLASSFPWGTVSPGLRS